MPDVKSIIDGVFLMELEYVEHRRGLPFKSFLVNMGYRTHHLHGELEIICVIDGAVNIDLGKESYSMSKNDVLVVNPYRIHSFESLSSENILLIIQARPSFYARNNPHIIFEEKIIENNSKIVPLMCALHLKSTEKTVSSEYYLSGLMNIITAHIADSLSFRLHNEKASEPYPGLVDRLRRIIEYMEENHKENITLEDLSKKFHLNRYYLSHFIKSSAGIGFRELLNNIRLTHGIKLLFESSRSISEVSDLAGFSDVKYLNSLLKEKYGCTAGMLREKMPSQPFYLSDSPKGSLHLPFDTKKAKMILEKNASFCGF